MDKNVVKIAKTIREIRDAMLVRKEVFVVEQGVALTAEIDVFDRIATHIVMYHDNSVPIAAARFRPYVDHYVKIERVAVLREYRQLGCGRKIMAFAEASAKDKAFNGVMLNAQT